jgi:hypothetical protein
MTNDHLWADLVRADGVHEARSSFADRLALWVDGTEVAHWDEHETLDIRLTRAVIRARRQELRADPRVRLRRSSSADWLEIGVRSPGHQAFALELLQVAMAAHGAIVGDRPQT